jgi:hypothetical protein
VVAVKSLRDIAAGGALTILVIAAISCSSRRDATGPEVVVYKTPFCGCCTKWVEHLRENGFVVTTQEVTDLTQEKTSRGVGQEIASCHTAVVDGYVIEGHVPADVIERLLEERPPVAGLTVPGMPMGSPGMEGAHEEPYEILTFDREGRTEIYARR